jgi:hypothetical protein
MTPGMASTRSQSAIGRSYSGKTRINVSPQSNTTALTMECLHFCRKTNVGIREATFCPCFLFGDPSLNPDGLHALAIGWAKRVILQDIQLGTGVICAQRTGNRLSLSGTGADFATRVATPGAAAVAGSIGQAVQSIPKCGKDGFQARDIEIAAVVAFLGERLP